MYARRLRHWALWRSKGPGYRSLRRTRRIMIMMIINNISKVFPDHGYVVTMQNCNAPLLHSRSPASNADILILVDLTKWIVLIPELVTDRLSCDATMHVHPRRAKNKHPKNCHVIIDVAFLCASCSPNCVTRDEARKCEAGVEFASIRRSLWVSLIFYRLQNHFLGCSTTQ